MASLLTVGIAGSSRALLGSPVLGAGLHSPPSFPRNHSAGLLPLGVAQRQSDLSLYNDAAGMTSRGGGVLVPLLAAALVGGGHIMEALMASATILAVDVADLSGQDIYRDLLQKFKKSPRSPGFRRKHKNEVLWIDSWSKSPRIKAELADMIPIRAQYGDGLNVDVKHGAPSIERDRIRGNHAQLFGGYQTGIRSSPSTSISAFKRGPRAGVNKKSSGPPGDVRMLCKAGQLKEGLHILNQQGIQADSKSYACLLQECINMKDLAEGKQVHAHIIQSGFKPDIFLFNTLVNMYAKCGSIKDARHVFDIMPERTLFSWTIMMAGYARNGCGREACKIYEQMQSEGVMPDKVTFICALNACASIGALQKGKEVHMNIIKAGIVPYIDLENSLVDMYAKCGSMKDACQVFNTMALRDVVSWNIMIGGYAQHGCGREAFNIYKQMLQGGVTPNRVTFICVAGACANLGALEEGKQVHADIIKARISSYLSLENTLVNMYTKCGSMKDAREVFDKMGVRDVFSWSAMIAGYAQHGRGKDALKIYEEMQQEGLMPNNVTFISVLSACASLGDLEKGKEVHVDIIKAGIASYITLENTLVDMYAKCGSMEDARQVFDKMADRNVVSWSAMITGYAQHGHGKEALVIYKQMKQVGVMPDRVTFICILDACANLGALESGKEVHADIIKAGILPYINLETALTDMYAKCGSMEDARQVFDNMSQRDVVSWNVMIARCAQHGCGREALQLFEQMQQEGLKPNGSTFISLLSACSHVGLVDEGCHYFYCMTIDHGLAPTMEQFSCMVDLLGRGGRMDEAQRLINHMPMKPDAGVWTALLGACRVHGDMELAEHAAEILLNVDPQDPAAYVLLSNVYAAAGQWDDKARERRMMENRGVRKDTGCSCIEVDNRVHTFVAEDEMHPQVEDVC